MNKEQLKNIAGGLWIGTGLFLIYRSSLLYQLAAEEQRASGGGIALSILAGLAIGAIKGKFVLSKTARKNKSRIESLVAPLKIHDTFPKPFYGFIVAMAFFGVALRAYNGYLGGYIVVGALYCGIGAALIASSLVYWKKEPHPAIEKKVTT